jgi:hypothetical protein
MSVGDIREHKAHQSYEPRYVIPRVGNLTEEKSSERTSEFPTGVLIPKLF